MLYGGRGITAEAMYYVKPPNIVTHEQLSYGHTYMFQRLVRLTGRQTGSLAT